MEMNIGMGLPFQNRTLNVSMACVQMYNYALSTEELAAAEQMTTAGCRICGKIAVMVQSCGDYENTHIAHTHTHMGTYTYGHIHR